MKSRKADTKITKGHSNRGSRQRRRGVHTNAAGFASPGADAPSKVASRTGLTGSATQTTWGVVASGTGGAAAGSGGGCIKQNRVKKQHANVREEEKEREDMKTDRVE